MLSHFLKHVPKCLIHWCPVGNNSRHQGEASYIEKWGLWATWQILNRVLWEERGAHYTQIQINMTSTLNHTHAVAVHLIKLVQADFNSRSNTVNVKASKSPLVCAPHAGPIPTRHLLPCCWCSPTPSGRISIPCPQKAAPTCRFCSIHMVRRGNGDIVTYSKNTAVFYTLVGKQQLQTIQKGWRR